MSIYEKLAPRRSKAVKPTTGYIGGGTAMQEVAVLRVCHIVNGHWWQTHAENPYFTPTRSPSESITFFETTWRVMGEFGVFCVVEKWNWHKEYYLRLTPLRALYAGVSACIFDMSKGSADSYMLSSLFPLLCFVNVLGEFVVTGQRARKYESMTLGGDNQEGAVQNVDAGMECEIMHYSQQKNVFWLWVTPIL